MPDHPLKQRLDRRLVSTQAHEQSYLKRTLRKRYPWRDHDKIAFAIVAARLAVAPSEARDRVLSICHELLRRDGVLD